MKDNFDIHAWNKERYLGKAPSIKDVTSKDFDLREWNKKRYLGELNIDDEREDQDVSATNVSGNINIDRGGDDAKMGAELESDENVVGEGVNDREKEGKLSDLSYDFLSNYFESERFNAPNPDDSSRTIYSPDQWEDWKSGIMKRFGDVDIKLDNQGYYDDDKFAILDKQFKADKEGFMKSKAAALDKIRQRTNFGLDEAFDELDDGFDPEMEALIKAGPRLNKERFKDVIYYIHNNWMAGNYGDDYAIRRISKYLNALEENVAPNHDGKAAPYGSGYKAVKETLRFIKENNPEFTNEEIKAELEEIKELGNQLNEKLCPKGEAYRKRRMAAGEKSSAYLSGRAVKVCKGQMSGKKKKKKK